MKFNSKFLRTADKLPQHHSTSFRGLTIMIEWPKGSVRVGEDKNGKKWHRKMEADYGYVPDTTAAGDREDLDVYVGPDQNAKKAYVVEQLTEDGDFDEYKVLLGFPDEDTAFETYLKHYPKDWADTRVEDVYEVPFDYLFDAVEEHQEQQEKTAASTGNPMLDSLLYPTHGMAQPAAERYVWISPGRNEDYILKGSFADHHKFQDPRYMNGRPIKKNQYDESPRGYAEVDKADKTVTLMVADKTKPSLAFIPESLVREFRDMFPGFQIVKYAAKTPSHIYLKAVELLK
jgi:hypothetical protein